MDDDHHRCQQCGQTLLTVPNNEEARQRLKKYLEEQYRNPQPIHLVPISEVVVCPGRRIKEQIYAGGREFFHTLGLIHDCIDKAVSLVSGLQQPPHSSDEQTARFNEIETDMGWQEVESYASDIVCALLGPSYKVVKWEEKDD